MVTAEVEYLGGLRTKCTHVRSGSEIITDAPVDNHGKGEAFSPTDLLATSYASCMITIMGIYCNEHHIPMSYARASVQKIMASNPRRVGELIIEIDLSGNNWDDETAEKVIRAGKACPVAKTIGDNIEIVLDLKH